MTDESNVIDFPVRASGAAEAAQSIGGIVVALKNTQAALDFTSKNAKAASDAVGGLSKNAKASSDALVGTAAQARAAAKEKDALAKAATAAAQAMTKERAAAADLVSSTLSPLTKEQEKLNKQIAQLTTELGRLREERQKALAGGFDQRSTQIDTRILNTQQALQQLRSSRFSISQQTLAGIPPGAAAIGPFAAQAGAGAGQAAAGFNSLATASARSLAALNVLGGELVHLDPQMATMVQSVGRASGAVGGFTSVLGPWALAIGAGVAAIGLYIDHTRRAQEETDRLAAAQLKSAEAARVQEKAYDDLSDSIAQKGLDKNGSTERNKQISDLTLGINDLRQQRAKLDRYNDEFELQGIDARIQQRRDAISKLRKEQKDADFYAGQQKQADIIDAIGEGIPEQKQRAERDKGGFAEYQRDQEILARIQKEQGAKESARLQSESEQRLAVKLRAIDAEHKAEIGALDTTHQLREEYARKQARIDQETTLRGAEMRQMFASNFASIGATGVAAFQQMAKGQKVTIKDFLSSLGDVMVAEGTRYMFKGGIEVLLGNPGGAAAAALGAAEVAAGIGLGAATRGGSSVNGSGSTSTGYNNRDSAPGGAVYWDGNRFVRGSPYAPVPSASQGGGSLTINQTVQYHSTFAPTERDAEAMSRAAREGLNKGTINPNWAQGG